MASKNGISMPIASADTLGGVKVGDGLNVSGDGTISAKYSMVYDSDAKTLAITGPSGDCSELTFNGVEPSAVTYNQNEVEKVTYNGDTIWQMASITAPTNLRVNSSTSSTSSTCKLTWTASTLTGASGSITYYIYKNGVKVATTTSTSYTFSTSTISGWSGATLTVKAYNSSAGFSAASNSVTFTYKSPTATVYAATTKCASSDNSSLANTNQSTSYVGRATSSKPVGTCIKFNAPSGGWGQYSKATLYVYRNGGSASANIKFGRLDVAYSTTLYCTKFYYGQYDTEIGSVDAGAASCWVPIDISSYLPSGSGELAITLMSKNAYCTVDGSTSGSTRAYIKLS